MLQGWCAHSRGSPLQDAHEERQLTAAAEHLSIALTAQSCAPVYGFGSNSDPHSCSKNASFDATVFSESSAGSHARRLGASLRRLLM
jgi:hypothetical protein